jgi:AcrR family transcriptional regulator
MTPRDQTGETAPEAPVPRRGGRPTREAAQRLDEDIQEAALALFLEHGYEGTSMAAVARSAGTTKASLYARFPSKEALFRSVVVWATHRSDWPVPEPEPPALDDLEGALSAIASSARRRALDPSMVQLTRIAVAEAARFPDLARQTHMVGWPRQRLVVELLLRHAGSGEIVAEDPEILAELFLARVAGMPARLASFNIKRDDADQELRQRVAIRLFLRSLRPT